MCIMNKVQWSIREITFQKTYQLFVINGKLCSKYLFFSVIACFSLYILYYTLNIKMKVVIKFREEVREEGKTFLFII